MTFRPLLGWNKPYNLEDVKYPCFVSYKLDGWRAWRMGPEFISRSFKTIPNRDLQRRFAHISSDIGDWDGELIAGQPGGGPQVFKNTDAICKSHERDASSIRYFVFDCFKNPGLEFWRRLELIRDLPPLVIKLDQHICHTPEEVLSLEQRALDGGFEGLCLRSPHGVYKYGRSTFREQYLLKLKRFLDGEARVVGFEELERNYNEAKINPLGLTERGHSQEGRVSAGILGSLVVEMEGVVFRVGTGFTQAERVAIWRNRDSYFGKICTVKYSPATKDKPRQPRFKGWRSDLNT